MTICDNLISVFSQPMFRNAARIALSDIGLAEVRPGNTYRASPVSFWSSVNISIACFDSGTRCGCFIGCSTQQASSRGNKQNKVSHLRWSASFFLVTTVMSLCGKTVGIFISKAASNFFDCSRGIGIFKTLG